MLEREFLTEQESSDVFTRLTGSVSTNLSQLDTQIENLGCVERRTLIGEDLTNFVENYTSMKSTIEELVTMVLLSS